MHNDDDQIIHIGLSYPAQINYIQLPLKGNPPEFSGAQFAPVAVQVTATAELTSMIVAPRLVATQDGFNLKQTSLSGMKLDCPKLQSTNNGQQ